MVSAAVRALLLLTPVALPVPPLVAVVGAPGEPLAVARAGAGAGTGGGAGVGAGVGADVGVVTDAIFVVAAEATGEGSPAVELPLLSSCIPGPCLATC